MEMMVSTVAVTVTATVTVTVTDGCTVLCLLVPLKISGG